ncbi:prepilin peptidase CpaA [Comamonas sp. BIGb0124]|uniref:A24 family peptidase n=1 Tax=Comamonas sp. BIGb0124 TaxID=2485130 RepID=UPI000F470B8E|nr:A24 family peptidase [Comamonas sp. BIGb0124]ROR21436.1 prepilin peptidase CpaA [Comamonas sp. BIGb0124]
MFIQLWLVAVIACDLLWRRVPNGLVLIGFLGWFLATSDFTNVVFWLGALSAFLILLPFYMMKWMGAGDVKFGIVAGLWFGFSFDLCWVWIGGSLLAGLHSLLSYAVSALQRRVEVKGVLLSLGLHRWINAVDDQRDQMKLNFSLLRNEKSNIKRVVPYAAYMAIIAFILVIKN